MSNFYLLCDHLKSSSVFVDQSGTTVATNYYLPYGGRRGGTFSTLSAKRFTGQYHEDGLTQSEGLSYYGARWYDAKLGRFLSADTIVPSPANPQAFNRYSYVINNPLRYVDPTGHSMATIDPGTGGGGRPRPGNIYLPIFNLPRPNNVYLPIFGSGRRPSAGPAGGSACLICVPSTPTVAPPLLSMFPSSRPTRAAQLLAGPTWTPTPGTYMGQSRQPWPTSTSVPSGSTNVPATYWSVVQYAAHDVPVEAYGWSWYARMTGRGLGTIKKFELPTIGLALSAGPNAYKNLQEGGPTNPELWEDLTLDSVGYGIGYWAGSSATAYYATYIGGGTAGPVGAGVGFLVGLGVGYVWDNLGSPLAETYVVDPISSWIRD